MEFRTDINGLRAIAVICVVLYHFGVPGFSAGFLGVDLFFVISGFLMMSIIVRGLEADRFSLWSFYVARARRIVPALTTLCIILLAAGWFWIPPHDYAALGKHAASALVFITNFTFHDEAGYFDNFSQDKWLLHTWSLSLEWQFYLLFPLVLIVIWRANKQAWLTAALTAIALLSFGISVIAVPENASFAFYLLPARAWELLAGALAFAASRKWKPKANTATLAHVGALALIFGAVTLFDGETAWPGYAAALPVLAATMIVAVPHPTASPFLSSVVLQRLGTWSYSIYLWHWPLTVALRHANLHNDPRWIIVAILASLTLGWCSYRLIEVPFKRPYQGSFRPRSAFGAAVFCLSIVGGLMSYRGAGLPLRASETVTAIESVIDHAKQLRPKPCDDAGLASAYPDCRDAIPEFVVVGDSHAGAAFVGVQHAAGTAYGVGYIRSCPPVIGGYMASKRKKSDCPDFTERMLDSISTLPPTTPVIFISRFSYYIHGYNEHPHKTVALRYLDVADATASAKPIDWFSKKLIETVCRAAEDGRKVYILRPLPEIGVEVPTALTRSMMLGRSPADIVIPFSEYVSRHQDVNFALDAAAKKCGVKILDPTPYLCDGVVCHGSKDGIPLYYDDDHLSEAGALKLSPIFDQVFDDISVHEVSNGF